QAREADSRPGPSWVSQYVSEEHRSKLRSATPTALGQAEPFYRTPQAPSIFPLGFVCGQPPRLPPHYWPVDPTRQTREASKPQPRESPPRTPSPPNPAADTPARRVPRPTRSRPPETAEGPIPLPPQSAAAPPRARSSSARAP